MIVTKINPQGCCMGVTRAMFIARKTVRENPDVPVYALGMLVHNRYAVDELTRLGIQSPPATCTDRKKWIDSMRPGILLLTAHGTSAFLRDYAVRHGMRIVDATCIDVKKTADIIEQRLKEGYEILYLGKQGHPEADAMISIDPSHIHLIRNLDDAKSSILNRDQHYALTCQTTLSFQQVDEIIDYFRHRNPAILIEPEICNATRKRQEAVLNSPQTDAFVIVGDPHSNNTRQLYLLAKTRARVALMVEDASQIDWAILQDCQSVSVTSGASTPAYLVDEVIKQLAEH